MSLELNFGDAVIRSAPVGGAVATDLVARFMGLTLHEWFYVATIGYTCIQGWSVVYKTLKEYKEDNTDDF